MRAGAVAADAPHGGTMMGRTTRWIFICSALTALVASGCAHSTGTVVPARIEGEAPSPSVTPTSPSTPTIGASPDAGGHTAGSIPARAATSAPVDQTTSTPTTPTTAIDGPRLSAGLGTAVDTAPSVRTRGDTRRLLTEGLFVHLAWEPDAKDPSVFTPLAEDLPILEAYIGAQLAYYRAALGLSRPDDPELDRFLVDGRVRFADAIAARAAAGLTLQLGSGVVLRPHVLGDQRTASTAVVLDCYLHDEQELPVGATAVPGPMRTYGLVATMVLLDGTWKVDRTGRETGVCL